MEIKQKQIIKCENKSKISHDSTELSMPMFFSIFLKLLYHFMVKNEKNWGRSQYTLILGKYADQYII